MSLTRFISNAMQCLQNKFEKSLESSLLGLQYL